MRKEMREQEQRLQKREDMLDRKLDTLSIKEKNLENLERSLADRKKNIEAKEKQLDETLAQQKRHAPAHHQHDHRGSPAIAADAHRKRSSATTPP